MRLLNANPFQHPGAVDINPQRINFIQGGSTYEYLAGLHPERWADS